MEPKTVRSRQASCDPSFQNPSHRIPLTVSFFNPCHPCAALLRRKWWENHFGLAFLHNEHLPLILLQRLVGNVLAAGNVGGDRDPLALQDLQTNGASKERPNGAVIRPEKMAAPVMFDNPDIFQKLYNPHEKGA